MADNLSPLKDESIVLDLGEFAEKKKAIRNLSGAAFIGERLYLANDEGRQLLWLTRESARRYARCEAIDVADLFELQEEEFDPKKEYDLEALAVDTRDDKSARLWLIGSHAMGHEEPPGTNLKRVGLKRERNRLLFGCVDVDEHGGLVAGTGRHMRIRPVGETWTTRFLSALRAAPPVASGFLREASALTQQAIPDALAQQVGWFTPYTLASTKENGLDIEGLVIRRRGDDSKVVALVGLRGPVIAGFAVIVEIAITDYGKRRLRPEGEPRFHLINLQGFGVRDLEWRGDDLLIIAGPTMTRQDESELFQWRNAWDVIDAHGSVTNVFEVETIDRLGRLPMNDDGGPEALATIAPGGHDYLLLRDGIKGERVVGSTYSAEVYRIEEP
jgi:hypothetical protein